MLSIRVANIRKFFQSAKYILMQRKRVQGARCRKANGNKQGDVSTMLRYVRHDVFLQREERERRDFFWWLCHQKKSLLSLILLYDSPVMSSGARSAESRHLLAIKPKYMLFQCTLSTFFFSLAMVADFNISKEKAL